MAQNASLYARVTVRITSRNDCDCGKSFAVLWLGKSALHFIAAYEALPIKSLTDLAVNGTILMETFNKKGGIWLKEALLVCETAVINQEVVNEQAALLEFLQETQSHLVSL